MAFDVLEKTPEVAPLLVRLYDTHNLYNLAGDAGSKDAHLELTTVMVDLLNIRLSEKESELITDVLLGLMRRAESDLKASLAERLSGMPEIPLRMVLALAGDEISVAETVLRKSPVLHDMDLVYILQAKGILHGRAIAHRAGLGETLVNMLADLRDAEIALNLCENKGVKLTDHAFEIFGEMAEDLALLARKMTLREDLPRAIAAKLYSFVGEELKAVLFEKMGTHAGAATRALNDIMVEFIDARIPGDDEKLDHLVDVAKNQSHRGQLQFLTLISSLRRSQYMTFTAQAAVFFDLPEETMKAVLKQKTGTSLAIACKALEVSMGDYISLYLLTERFRNAQRRVIGHEELGRTMRSYDSINPVYALKMLNDSRK